MALFLAEDHADNPPETWVVVKSGRKWNLTTADGVTIDSYVTRKLAVAAKRVGWLVDLYEKERRWYAGEDIPGWKPYRKEAS